MWIQRRLWIQGRPWIQSSAEPDIPSEVNCLKYYTGSVFITNRVTQWVNSHSLLPHCLQEEFSVSAMWDMWTANGVIQLCSSIAFLIHLRRDQNWVEITSVLVTYLRPLIGFLCPALAHAQYSTARIASCEVMFWEPLNLLYDRHGNRLHDSCHKML